MSNIKNEFVVSKEVLEYFDGDALAAQLWMSKYALPDEKTPKDMFARFANEFSIQEAETLKTALPKFNKKKFEQLSSFGQIRFKDLLELKEKHFGWFKNADDFQRYKYAEYFNLFDRFKHSILGGSAMQGIGADNYSSLSNCFVTGRPHDSYGGIISKGHDNIQLMKRRGGVGVDLSSIRPATASVNNQAKYSSGPVLFAQRYSNDTREVAQDGRRGAAMISLYIQHPDAREFIVAKQDPTKITGANISVVIDNEFMQAVTSDQPYLHRFPIDMRVEDFNPEDYNFDELYTVQYNDSKGQIKEGYIKKISALDLWQTLIACSHNTAEPGIMFLDNHLDYDPSAVYPQYKPVTSNPCFAGKTPLLTSKGYFSIESLVGQTVNVWNGAEWSEVTIELTGANQKMMKVICSDGSEHECTEYHKWPIEKDNGESEMVETKDLCTHIDKIAKFRLPIVCDSHLNGPRDSTYKVPVNADLETRLYWLSDLFDTWGFETSNEFFFEMASKNQADQVRLLLSTLGVHSSIISRNSIWYVTIDDDSQKYLDNFRAGLALGMSEGLMQKENVRIISVEPIEDAEKVYCFNEPKRHMGVFNGLLLGQCGEIMMQPYDSCRLIASNLLSFVINPFEQSAVFHWSKFYEYSYNQMIAGNTLVDLELTYVQKIIDKIRSTVCETEEESFYQNQELNLWEKIYETGKNSRRVGSGFLALADTLAALNLNYGDSQSLWFVRSLFQNKMLAELDATIDLAIIYGPFDGWNPKNELPTASPFYDRLKQRYPEEYARMQKFGRRNVSWSTAAPTGTQALMTQTSSGIEPLFLPFYKRRKKCIGKNETVHFVDADGEKFTEFVVIHEPLKQWLNVCYQNNTHIKITKAQLKQVANGTIDLKLLQEWFEKSPYYNNCAADLNIDNRIAMQSIVQEYTTHSISSTVNLAENCKPSEIDEIFIKAWQNKLKGITVYRDGCRNGVLVGVGGDGDGKTAETGFLGKRPKSLKAHYHTLKYRNKVYSVIIGLTEDNKPYECFIISGINNLPENMDYDDVIEGVTTKEYTDLYYFEAPTFLIKDIQDCEAEEKLIGLTISGLMSSQTPLVKIIKILLKSKPIAGSFTHRLVKIFSKYIVDGESTGDKCPVCGEKLVFENGCFICKNCGHTKC